jgi:PII-like signaling protein
MPENTNNAQNVIVVRVYLTEGKGQMEQLLKKLHDQFQIRGVTVFRGVSGFGQSGKLHESSLLDLSLDLPVVLEFFDIPEKIQPVIVELKQTLKPGHYIYWSANTNF